MVNENNELYRLIMMGVDALNETAEECFTDFAKQKRLAAAKELETFAISIYKNEITIKKEK